MKIYFSLILIALISCSQSISCQSISSFDDLNYPYNVKNITILNNINVAYVEEGKGKETILFIHGLGSYLPAWKKNIEELKNYYRCIAIDLPGYGKSSKSSISADMTFYSDVVKGIIKKKKLKNVILAGHSMGGQIALTLAIQSPETVKKLILVDPAGFERFSESQKEWFKGFLKPELIKNTSKVIIKSNIEKNFYKFPKDAEFMITDRIAMRDAKEFDNYCEVIVRSIKGMLDQPVFNRLNTISQETLIFFGENDNLIPNKFLNPVTTNKIALDGTEKIKNSKLLMVPEVGHFMMFEQSNYFNKEVKIFLDKE